MMIGTPQGSCLLTLGCSHPEWGRMEQEGEAPLEEGRLAPVPLSVVHFVGRP